MSGASSATIIEQLLASGACCVGEIAIARQADGTFTLTHRDDAQRRELEAFAGAGHAASVARCDDNGRYRPLKTAPNLRHGWRLQLTSAADVERAIDAFYPGRLAALRAFRNGKLQTTSLRETLGRQTGMYRVASRVTDAQLDELIGTFCGSDGGCLRTILWKRDAAGQLPSSRLPQAKYDPAHDQVGRGERAIPLLCQEACNLLVAAARAVVKASSA